MKDINKRPKKEIFFQERYLDTDKEYTIDELQKEAINSIDSFSSYLHLPFTLELSTWKVKAYTEYGEYGDPDRAEFRLMFYRWEDEKEYKERLLKEDKQDKLNKENAKKSQEIAKKKAKEAKLKQEALEADPDYQKYLELQNKFKK